MEFNLNEISVIAFIAALAWWKTVQLLRELRRRAGIDRASAYSGEERAVPLYEGLPVAERHLSGEAERCFARIREAVGGLDEERFRHNGCRVYEAVVTAFAKGDRDLLRKYLAADVYETFARSIEERERQHRRLEFSLIRLKHADIVDARIAEGHAAVSIDFESEVVSAMRDEAGEVVDGDALHIVTARDRWTFAREWDSPSQAWLLATTETVENCRAASRKPERQEIGENTEKFRSRV